MWLVSAVVLTALGAALTGAGMVTGRRGDERATAFFAAGLGVFALGTGLLALSLLVS